MSRFPILASTALFAVACVAQLATAQEGRGRQENWWENSPNYNEDEWYDPTDWFDGNNYERNEAVRQRPEERRSRTAENSRRNDRRNAEALSDRIVHVGSNGVAFYRDEDNDGIYEQSHRYYDFNQDGDFDAYMSLFDRNHDGRYEAMDFVSFAPIDWQERAGLQAQASSDSRRHRLSGDIQSLNEVRTGGSRHVVAIIDGSQGNQQRVDLGPVSQLAGLDLRRGDRITVLGPAANVGGGTIVMADEVQANGRTERIDRSTAHVRGTLESIRYADARGIQHALGMVESQDGRRVWIDFGPAQNLNELILEPGRSLSASGPIVRVDGKPVLMAQTVRHRDVTASIDRDLNHRGEENRLADRPPPPQQRRNGR
jgi:hypothetical protein